MPNFVKAAIAKVKDNKIATAVILAVAAGVDHYFGLGLTATILDIFASAPEVLP